MTLKRQRGGPAAPEAVVVTGATIITREERTGRRTMRRRSQGWAGALVISCLVWLLVILPALACALGWLLR